MTPLSSLPPPVGTAVAEPPAPTLSPLPTQTPLVPLVALVNGEPITLAEFELELSRYQAALGANAAQNSAQLVLNELVDQLLLAQGARQTGFVVDETLLQVRLESLEAQLGGHQALMDWISTHGYTEPDFRLVLARSIAAAWMRDQIIAAVPEVAEQAHARQILLYNSEQANQVYALLQSGQDFTALAADYAPLTGGDLGWFPRGYLTEPVLEAAVFALAPGEYSPVIETRLGYHILQLIEMDSARPLLPEARRVLQLNALQDWLQERRAQSDLQFFLP